MEEFFREVFESLGVEFDEEESLRAVALTLGSVAARDRGDWETADRLGEELAALIRSKIEGE